MRRVTTIFVPLIRKNLPNNEFKRFYSLGAQAVQIDGKSIAAQIRAELKTEVADWIAQNHRAPCLKTVLVGDNAASQRYVKNKVEAAREVGLNSDTILLSANATQTEILDCVESLNRDACVDGILVQLPLPEHVDEQLVCNAVAADKDVDGFHVQNVGKWALNMDTMVPCTALGVVELLRRYKIQTHGKNVVVCGRSKHVGLPIAMLLHSDAKYDLPGLEATVVMCNRSTPPELLRQHTRNADIIITATGVVGLITADMVKPGACVIDIGINRIVGENGKDKIVGDVDYEGVRKVAGHITPVPGGVGPMTVAMLLKNTIKAAKALTKSKTEIVNTVQA